MPRSRLVLGLAALALVASAPLSTAAPRGTHAGADFTAKTPPQTRGLPDLDRLDPVRYSYGNAIREHVQVTSRDGVNQIWVDLIRPRTPSTVKVPAIMMASPYFNTLGRGFKGECKTPTQSPPGGLPFSPGCGSKVTAFPEWYDEYFVPRGYAFVAMDLRGTRNTSGCQAYGDRDEVFDAVDVVDWIASQSWSNGRVGMTGGSYDGTIALGAAAEAPISAKHKDALAAVIPIRAIDAWYDYHFLNGVESQDHLLTPSAFTAEYAAEDLPNSGTADQLYAAHLAQRKACIASFGAATDAQYAPPYQNANSAFWAERDFRKDAAHVRAATFFIHGLFDFNVKTVNVGNMWLSLPKKLPKKLWLMNGDHVDPRCPDEETCAASGHQIPYPFADKFIEGTHRWWLQFLKKVPAGALAGAPVEIQRSNGSWAPSAAYPASRSDLVLYPSSKGGLGPKPSGDGDSVTWADNPQHAGAPGTVSFTTAPFTKATRLSGQVEFDLRYAVTGTDTNIAIRVDDLGPGADDTDPPGNDLYDGSADVFTVTYGWLQALVRASVHPRGPSTPVIGTPLTPETPVVSRFPSLYTDYVVAKGHRLRFTFADSAGGTVATYAGGIVTLYTGPKASTIRLPVVR